MDSPPTDGRTGGGSRPPRTCLEISPPALQGCAVLSCCFFYFKMHEHEGHFASLGCLGGLLGGSWGAFWCSWGVWGGLWRGLGEVLEGFGGPWTPKLIKSRWYKLGGSHFGESKCVKNHYKPFSKTSWSSEGVLTMLLIDLS